MKWRGDEGRQIKGSGAGHVINCRFHGSLDHKPELVVRVSRLSLLLRNQHGILLCPCPRFSPVCFHHCPRLLDLVSDAGDLMRYLLFGLFQKIQSIDDVSGWHFVAEVVEQEESKERLVIVDRL